MIWSAPSRTDWLPMRSRECIHWNKEHTDVKCLAGSLDMDNDMCFLKAEGYDKRNTTSVCTLYSGGQPRKL